jgi:hypothetical protein
VTGTRFVAGGAEAAARKMTESARNRRMRDSLSPV